MRIHSHLVFILAISATHLLYAQGTRPEAGPFDASHMEMQPPPAQGIAIRAGRLFDSKSGAMLTNQVILIKGDRITAAGPFGSVSIPPGAMVIDLSRATVLPGLIDRHVHLMQDQQPNDARAAFSGLNYALKDLNAGFTTLQDMGSPYTYATVELRDAINKGQVPGPRLQVAGPQLNPRAATYYPAPSVVTPFGQTGGPNAWQLSGDVNSPWLARAAVREHSHYGVDWIKVYETEDYEGGGYPDPAGAGAFTPDGKMINVPSLTLEENQAIVDEAHRRGLRVACHAYGGEGLRNCLEAGVDMPMHVIVGVTGAEGLDDETIRLFKKPLWDGTQRPVMQTLWDLIGDMEGRDLKASGGHTTRFRLTEMSFQASGGGGRERGFRKRRVHQWPRRAGFSIRLLREMGHDARAGSANGYQQRRRKPEFRFGQAGGKRGTWQIRRPGGRFRRSAHRHHRNAAREIRHERRGGFSK